MIDTSLEIKTVSLIGSGNLATHLGISLQKSGLVINEVYSPQIHHAENLAKTLGCRPIDTLAGLSSSSNLYLICVSDRFIENVAKAMPVVNGIVAHTSGITSLDVLSIFSSYGVFYPLQSFTKERYVDLQKVPFCIEAFPADVFKPLSALASLLSHKVCQINTGQRMQLHLAAVFVNNFVNFLYVVAGDILRERELSYDFLLPLIEETAAKVLTVSPEKIQTGPARRNDNTTIDRHLEMLEKIPEYKLLYEKFTQLIKKKYYE